MNKKTFKDVKVGNILYCPFIKHSSISAFDALEDIVEIRESTVNQILDLHKAGYTIYTIDGLILRPDDLSKTLYPTISSCVFTTKEDAYEYARELILKEICKLHEDLSKMFKRLDILTKIYFKKV